MNLLSPHFDTICLWAVRLAVACALWLWLRRALTPQRFLSIFETDGTLSARQILAWVLALFGLSMRAAGRLDDAGLSNILGWAVGLFGIGGAVKLAGAVKPAATVNARQATVQAETANINSPTPVTNAENHAPN